MPGPLCAVCGQQPATYVCQICGRPACGNCFDATSWTCHGCRTKAPEQTPDTSYAPPLRLGLPGLLFLLAFAAIFIGALLIALGSIPGVGNVSGGAVILIGPIPIILGSGPYSSVLVGLAVVLTIVAAVVFLIARRRV